MKKVKLPPIDLMPYARITDMQWNASITGPLAKELHHLHTRLVGKALYFFPVQWMAEAMDMPIDAIKGRLDPERCEIITDETGEIRKWLWPKEGKTYRLYHDVDTFVTTFGLQKLMRLKEQKAKRAQVVRLVSRDRGDG